MWTLLSITLIVSVLIEATLQQPQSERFFRKKKPEHLRKCTYRCGEERVGIEQINQPGYEALVEYHYGSSDAPDNVRYSASVISYRHLLTVARPLLRPRNSGEPLAPGFGPEGGIYMLMYGSYLIFYTDHYIVSPEFLTHPTAKNDYALLRLFRRFDYLNRLCIPPANFDILSMIGSNPPQQLSFTREKKPHGPELEENHVRHTEVQVEMFSMSNCMSFLSRWRRGKDFICAGCTERWTGPCAETAGAPLVYKNPEGRKVQVGLTQSYMGVQTKPSRYYSYIKVDGAFREWVIAEVTADEDEVCHG